MVEVHKAKRDEDEFFRLQAKISRAARRKGILTENDVDRIVFNDP